MRACARSLSIMFAGQMFVERRVSNPHVHFDHSKSYYHIDANHYLVQIIEISEAGSTPVTIRLKVAATPKSKTARANSPTRNYHAQFHEPYRYCPGL